MILKKTMAAFEKSRRAQLEKNKTDQTLEIEYYRVPLVELVERVATSGQITPNDQELINQSVQTELNHLDIMAIRHLTDLIRDGIVEVL
jgi:hypothetical protein